MWGEMVFEGSGAASRPSGMREWKPYEWLHAAYYAQRRFHRARGRFAGSMDELQAGQVGLASAPEGWTPEIVPMNGAWMARVRRGAETMAIRGDSRIVRG
jgi:hypothetical protein